MILTAVIVIAILALIFIYASIRILREYERGVVFTLGRYTGTKGPGLFLLVPIVQQMVRVDLRVVAPGLIGAISLLVALYALAPLPISYAGAARGRR